MDLRNIDQHALTCISRRILEDEPIGPGVNRDTHAVAVRSIAAELSEKCLADTRAVLTTIAEGAIKEQVTIEVARKRMTDAIEASHSLILRSLCDPKRF